MNLGRPPMPRPLYGKNQALAGLNLCPSRTARPPWGARPTGQCNPTGPAWETPRPVWVGAGLPYLGAGPYNGLYLAFTPKPVSIREGKTAYMAKPYGTLSEYES